MTESESSPQPTDPTLEVLSRGQGEGQGEEEEEEEELSLPV